MHKPIEESQNTTAKKLLDIQLTCTQLKFRTKQKTKFLNTGHWQILPVYQLSTECSAFISSCVARKPLIKAGFGV